MGITHDATVRIGSLKERVSKTILERKITRGDVLEKFTDDELLDLDAVLQVAYFILHRQKAAGRAERTLGEVIKIVEQAALDVEGSDHRSEDILARAEAAVSRIREFHVRAMPRTGRNYA